MILKYNFEIINMDILTIITEATKPKQGNKPKYDESHVLHALLVIQKEQPIGRPTLEKRLQLGDATVRTLLRRLRELGVIKVDKVGGAEITEEGKKALQEWDSVIKIGEAELKSINWDCSMIIVKGGSKILEKQKVIELRDKIIKLGADSVLISVILNNKVELPPKTEEFGMKKLLEDIKNSCRLCENNDLITYILPKDLHLAYKVGLLLFENWINS
jgi:predicted transcriptional regulator